MDSILISVKKLLGISKDYTHFDADIIIHINTVFMILYQLGVGPDKPFSISDSSSVWSDFTQDATNIEAVKTYMYMKVRNYFDPPQSSAVADASNNIISELEWRLNVAVDPGEEEKW